VPSVSQPARAAEVLRRRRMSSQLSGDWQHPYARIGQALRLRSKISRGVIGERALQPKRVFKPRSFKMQGMRDLRGRVFDSAK